ncbi:MAG: peptide chain release factor N(5)-glutamine methyltransferase [Clostridia bacterium]|nr:peptide chain release factor N(5)-glutamine methyltransferase [Clostridia bacterium]NCC44543.1 peptide chain release factor N(5)-glutamine methyltransferase [Clostridia bacterium]
MTTLRELLKYGEQELGQAGVPDAANDAWALMEFVFGIEKGYYFLHGDDKIDEKQQAGYKELIECRRERIPLQQITGTAWFMGYEFYVNEHVLIPRFDTEILVDESGKLLKTGMKILDVCTGSGCILLSLLAEHKELDLSGTGVDISKEALLVARENQKRLMLEADFIESDLLAGVGDEIYDLIISNPPYIQTSELAGLMPEVREHEPMLALDGKEDGLYFYRKIIEQASEHLRPGGWLCFEIGYDQGEALYRMLDTAGYENVRIGKDLAGLDRTAFGQKEKDKTRRIEDV